ncbi:MAG: thiamine phosphate synthase, partial [Planctomycetota bacterium]
MSRSPARTLDANANRAREAARTLEDIARFVLDRADLAATLKEARHAVTSAIEAAGFDRLELLAARDTAGDTGTGTTTAAETDRA